MKSTIYIKCPKCGQTALVQELQGKYLCASCNFDYTALKESPGELDTILVENMKMGPSGQIMSLALHRMVTLMPNQESVDYVKSLAERNGIKFPDAKKKCYVASCCYGSPDAYEVFVLRYWRDNVLSKSLTGKLFVEVYYRISPMCVRLIGNSPLIKKILRALVLDRITGKILKNA